MTNFTTEPSESSVVIGEVLGHALGAEHPVAPGFIDALKDDDSVFNTLVSRGLGMDDADAETQMAMEALAFAAAVFYRYDLDLDTFVDSSREAYGQIENVVTSAYAEAYVDNDFETPEHPVWDALANQVPAA